MPEKMQTNGSVPYGAPSVANSGGGMEGMASQQKSDYLVLMHAISTCSGLAVVNLLNLSPELVHVRGWNGHTPLHKACLTGDYNIVNLLLQHGADPNIANDFNETPVHYASKRGIPSLVHLLVQKGGNLNIVDKKGRTVMHDAAQAGSVYMMQYFAEKGMGFSDTDEDLQTPLHIACTFGHLDAFRYLTRKQRCDPTLPDAGGNTPLHICCREGHMHGSWLLISHLGSKALKVKNKNGYTPIDLCRQKDKIEHKTLLPLLEIWDQKKPTESIRGPLFMWYGLLLMPFVTYTLAILLSLIFSSVQGLIYFSAGIYIGVYVSRSKHRLTHPARWASPIHAGMFFAGMCHTMLVYYVHVVQYISEYQFLVLISAILTLYQLYIYKQLLMTDPGVVRSGVVDPHSNKPSTVTDLCTPGRKLDQYCVTCEFVRLELTKHCKLCDKCLHGMDHHCLFLLKCVAKNNHTRFVWFIILTVTFMIIFLLEVLLYVSVRYPTLTYSSVLSYMFWYDGWVLSMSVFNVGSIVWAFVLLRAQFAIISKGQTFYFQGSACTLTPTERLLNVIYFLQGKPPFARDFIMDAEDHKNSKSGGGHSHHV